MKPHRDARRPDADFDLSDFDHRGHRRTPRLLLVVLAFLCRYPVILALEAFSSFMLGRRGMRFDALALPPLEALAAGLPAVVLLALVLLGEKARAATWRAVLCHGRAIAIATCLAQWLVLARIFLAGDASPNLLVIETVLVGYALVYLVRSPKAARYFRLRGRAHAKEA